MYKVLFLFFLISSTHVPVQARANLTCQDIIDSRWTDGKGGGGGLGAIEYYDQCMLTGYFGEEYQKFIENNKNPNDPSINYEKYLLKKTDQYPRQICEYNEKILEAGIARYLYDQALEKKNLQISIAYKYLDKKCVLLRKKHSSNGSFIYFINE